MAAGASFADDIQVLPKYSVSANVVAAMVPCDQVNEIREQAAAFRDVFDFSVITILPAPTVDSNRRIRCFIRARDGRIIQEITNDSDQYPVDAHWPAAFLSSNQPVEFPSFYLMLKPRLPAGKVTLADADQLLHAYMTFSEQRLRDTITYYGGGSWSIDLRWATVPDEIAVIARSPQAAAAIGQRLGVEPEGPVVRISAQDLAALKARNGGGFAIGDNTSEIDCLTPWRQTTGQPPVWQHAALFQLGWVKYQSSTTGEPQYERIAVAMSSVPGRTGGAN